VRVKSGDESRFPTVGKGRGDAFFPVAEGGFMGDGWQAISMSETTLQNNGIPELAPRPSKAFMPYPVSTLSPPIIPADLTSFKTRGISEVERDLRQKLTEIREDYLRAIDHFNWNKLVYEAEIRFEPVVGEVYHLYDMGSGWRALSMIGPEQWQHRHLATVRLNYDRQWLVVRTGEGIESAELFGVL
jgi:hypothetical protein